MISWGKVHLCWDQWTEHFVEAMIEETSLQTV